MAPREQLEREIERLEGQLDRASDARGELVTIRRGLGKPGPRESAIELPNLRLGFKCKQRWEDMVGDERVRACAGCDRPVFNLSEMTRAEAEAVLATRGLTPCVRFYRRPDGTVMTSDCPTGVRPQRRLAAVAVAAGTTLASGSAFADPWVAAQPGDPEVPASSETSEEPAPSTFAEPPPTETEPVTVPGETIDVQGERVEIEQGGMLMGIPIDHGWEMGDIEYVPYRNRTAVEWSLWTRLGVGIASPERPESITRSVTPPPMATSSTSTWEAALTGELTFRAGRGDLRLGVFGEVRTSSDPVFGGELVLEGLPPRPDTSSIGGAGNFVVRVGGNDRLITTAFGFGYVGSFSRTDPWIPWMRHMVGTRVLVSMNHARDEPGNWSALIGVEVEPLGAVRALVEHVTE
jgi:hypothetical protein